ncbi:DEAD/DEAH box helicase [Gloeobacter violaceus]|uniref:RNA helicase n=1 Tax=Gloeobacter violaceus (strain ATCC 29082 / PCC 7421) TaxID=251221 RepID=Q7NH01_GLOVI|nr:DEAD/DEAH box helicase [Gloeobacter violaceus]BAC90677.1 gll2736 [Gloeobacter violaceus PCC 7421]
MKLRDLLQKGDAALTSASHLMGQGLVVLDCTGVEALTEKQLTLLFSDIPEGWGFLELAEVLDSATLTGGFADQLSQEIVRRNGSASEPKTAPRPEALEPPEIAPAIVKQSVSRATVLHPIRALDKVIAGYRDYLLTEFRAKDPALKQALEKALDEPLFLAQEPFFQAHRPFKDGQRWRELPIDQKLAQVMEKRSNNKRAYLHQSEGIAHLLGPQASPLVVTTGTGSGKSETFLLPVIQNAIEDAVHFKQPGLTAILVYPMNALANDQLQRIRQYLQESGWSGAVSVEQYDRGTKQADRERLRQNPPHILLTNYMMLEYLLVRPADRDAIFANHRCRFLVLDEVHTYRGTLGSNIALLVRRLKTHLGRARHDWLADVAAAQRARRYPELLPVGTSATIKSVGEQGQLPRAELVRLRDEAVQDFFSKLTGAEPQTIRVLGEQLQDVEIPGEAQYPLHWSAVEEVDVSDAEAVRQALCTLSGQNPDTPLDQATRRCRLLWDLNRWLIGSPMSISQLVARVRVEVPERKGCREADIESEVRAALSIGAALPENIPGVLRLRIHRFVRGGWRFHRCVSPTCGKLYPMGEERCECSASTAPLYLCRNCGADYLRFVGGNPNDPAAGPLQPSASNSEEYEWLLYDPARFELTADIEEEEEEAGNNTLQRSRSRRQPTQMRQRLVREGSFDPHTLAFSVDTTTYPLRATLAPARTQCLCCGGSAGSRNVITPVALGTSAAVKVMGEGLVEALAEENKNRPNHDGKERLLVFSDSRQDAAHQARFIHFASRYDRMRRRIVRLLNGHGVLTIQRMVELLGEEGVRERDNPYVPEENNSWLPDETLQRIRVWEEAPLLDEIAVNAGYRATLINLGLVSVTYDRLSEYVQARGSALAKALGVTLSQLEHICRCLLDEMRVRGCLSRELLRFHPAHPSYPAYMRAAEWERRVKRPQGYAATSEGNPAAYLDSTQVESGIKLNNAWRRPRIGGKGPSLERILKHLINCFGGAAPTVDRMVELLQFLKDGSYLVAFELLGYRERARLLQVQAEQVRLKLVTAHVRMHCRVCGFVLAEAPERFPCPRCHGYFIRWVDAEDNRTVRRIYSEQFVPLIAREHTAQIPGDIRVQLENDFKASAEVSKVNLLACSPTLEMGIDVGGLDAVILRNVPPRPDNYAQRGGRAGRRTRVGLVLGYARSTPHDQYFYDKPAEMISGEVPAPALALGNRDVILRHLNAIAFGTAEPGLAGKMVEYVSPAGEINQQAVDALIASVTAQQEYALSMAQDAWGVDILPAAMLDTSQLRHNLKSLRERIQDVVERTARQVQELRRALDTYAAALTGRRAAAQAGDMVARLLGIETERRRNQQEADDGSAGYPLRRFAEFGILPGYEFPTQPASLRLLGDPHEEDPVTVARRFGIAQFQPEAQVYARTKRWQVIGLDNASPWNPKDEGPNWAYRLCQSCQLRYDAAHPRCPRCQADLPGQPIPAAEFGGFLARPNENTILDEEDRYATGNLVKTFPQWDGDVVGRWSVGPDWSLRLSRGEEVRWLNEGRPPTPKEIDDGMPYLHPDAKGYLLCGSCGRSLTPQSLLDAGSKRRNVRTRDSQQDVHGHREDCPQAGTALRPLAIVTALKAEVLRLVIPVPSSVEQRGLQSWGLSLGFSLRTGMRHVYMLDGSEIEFELEGPWQAVKDNARFNWVSLSFIDPSIGGSGYLSRIASELHIVARAAIDHLDHTGCETACYRCLKSYQNQRFHELLHWPRIIADLHQLAEGPPIRQNLQMSDIDDPHPWLEAYAEKVGSPLELKFLRLFEEYGFHPRKQVPIAVHAGEPPISLADFAVAEKKLAIYIDGASFHQGQNLRRDRFIRERLRDADPAWRIVELKANDLARGGSLVMHLMQLLEISL